WSSGVGAFGGGWGGGGFGGGFGGGGGGGFGGFGGGRSGGGGGGGGWGHRHASTATRKSPGRFRVFVADRSGALRYEYDATIITSTGCAGARLAADRLFLQQIRLAGKTPH